MNNAAAKLAAAQNVYAAAKALEETLEAEYAAACEKAGLVETAEMSMEECERIWEAQEDIRVAFPIDEANDARRAAEREMVEIAHQIAMRRATKAQRAELGNIVERALRDFVAWPKLVDLAFRLAA